MTKNFFTFDEFFSDLKQFREKNRHFPVFSIGKSIEDRDIYAIKLGCGTKRIFLSGAYHGCESITAKILFRFLCELSQKPLSGNVSVYFVPMVNPDGIEIASTGKFWQANARGVDINHNFDALWTLSKKSEEAYGITEPGPTRFGGEYPESEPETKAIADFTRQNNFDTVAAIHSQGEVIYYDFCGNVPPGTYEYLDRFEAVSRYKRAIPEGIASFGGFKDWFIKKYRRPAFTIEAGLGENPLPMSEFDDIYNGILPILYELIK